MATPTLLTPGEVADGLATLPHWRGGTEGLVRSVAVDGPEAVLAKVGALADELDHHPVVERDGPVLTFLVWTHVSGGVTHRDLRLARAIEAVLEESV